MIERYRHELKFICPETVLEIMESRLRVIMKPDIHAGENGEYEVRSVYFDDIYRSCFHENENGNDLADALYGSAEPAMEFGSDALSTVDGELAGERVSGEYPLILKPGYIQYGPYCRMEKGDYHILIKGAGLDSLWNDCIYVNINEYDGDLTVSDARINERSICYDLTLSEGASNVEFCITDYSENEVKIKSIQVYNRIFIPETVKKWW